MTTPALNELVRVWVEAMNAKREAYRIIQDNPCEEAYGASGDMYHGDYDPGEPACWDSCDVALLDDDEICPGCLLQIPERRRMPGLHKAMVEARRRLLYYARKMLERGEL